MKIKKESLCIFIFSFLIACDSGNDNSILVDGTEYPPLPASAIKEPYEDDENMVKVTIKDLQGNISSQGDYYKGLREGAWTDFHPNGFPKTFTSYVDGLKQGIFLTIDNRGQLQERGYYHNDKLHGPYIVYNRARLKEERFYKNGQLDGLVKKFYDNGKIMEESTYKDGKLHGTARWYDREGNLTIEYEYVEGQWIEPEGEVN